eukprot:TRINITY_DN11598_c0_g1_i1.p1 TRINITY_DN11598_c0_g1~~TRINITY_DN11598_c0_g1_i1.p1  ORF type:complete len:694 (+),score=230.19 TRINITY_DN11598_c0_g1_i1:38-2119(+)
MSIKTVGIVSAVAVAIGVAAIGIASWIDYSSGKPAPEEGKKKKKNGKKKPSRTTSPAPKTAEKKEAETKKPEPKKEVEQKKEPEKKKELTKEEIERQNLLTTATKLEFAYNEGDMLWQQSSLDDAIGAYSLGLKVLDGNEDLLKIPETDQRTPNIEVSKLAHRLLLRRALAYIEKYNKLEDSHEDKSTREALSSSIKDADLSLAHYYNNPVAHIIKGYALKRKRETTKALDSYLTAFDISPNYAYFGGSIGAPSGVPIIDEARVVITKLLRKEADRLKAAASYPRAISHYTHFLKLNPTHKDRVAVLASRALCQLQLSELSFCMDDAKIMMKDYPSDSRGFYFAGQVKRKQSQNEEALQYFEEAVKRDPKDPASSYIKPLKDTIAASKEKEQKEQPSATSAVPVSTATEAAVESKKAPSMDSAPSSSSVPVPTATTESVSSSSAATSAPFTTTATTTNTTATTPIAASPSPPPPLVSSSTLSASTTPTSTTQNSSQILDGSLVVISQPSSLAATVSAPSTSSSSSSTISPSSTTVTSPIPTPNPLQSTSQTSLLLGSHSMSSQILNGTESLTMLDSATSLASSNNSLAAFSTTPVPSPSTSDSLSSSSPSPSSSPSSSSSSASSSASAASEAASSSLPAATVTTMSPPETSSVQSASTPNTTTTAAPLDDAPAVVPESNMTTPPTTVSLQPIA